MGEVRARETLHTLFRKLSFDERDEEREEKRKGRNSGDSIGQKIRKTRRVGFFFVEKFLNLNYEE